MINNVNLLLASDNTVGQSGYLLTFIIIISSSKQQQRKAAAA